VNYREWKGAMPTNQKSKQAIACFSILSYLLVSGTLSTSSMAEEVRRPSAEGGLELAQKFCQACHIVTAEGGETAPVGPPSFPSIANKPEQTAEDKRNGAPRRIRHRQQKRFGTHGYIYDRNTI